MPEQITDKNKKFPLELKWPIEDDLPFLYTTVSTDVRMKKSKLT
jgi:hypothetical protein